MVSFGRLIADESQQLERRWYEAWQRSPHPHPELSEAALKNTLANQVRIIGEAMEADGPREAPEGLWQIRGRLHPEQRVDQQILIEEVVHEYGLLIDVVRTWVEERGLEVSFGDYSYFHQAVLELIAESVRRFARHQAEQVSRSRGDYLAGLAHQMRTPLSTLRFTVEQLVRPAARSDSAMAMLRRNVDRLSLLVNGVMRLERFKADELPVKPQRVRPAALVDDIVRDHEHEALRKGLRLEVEVNRTLEMDLDPDLFIDALGNLVQNAVKYTERGRVRVEVRDEGDTVEFRVIDTGPGMSTERRQTLFQPVIPQKPGGVGLGLTIAARAVVAQGGVIGADSGPEGGTTVWFRLPRAVVARKGGEA
jgi:two-component system sensor histidine kinase SenX3